MFGHTYLSWRLEGDSLGYPTTIRAIHYSFTAIHSTMATILGLPVQCGCPTQLFDLPNTGGFTAKDQSILLHDCYELRLLTQ